MSSQCPATTIHVTNVVVHPDSMEHNPTKIQRGYHHSQILILVVHSLRR